MAAWSARDMRTAHKARKTLRQFSCHDLIERVATAADLFETETLPLGNGTQSLDEFVHQQSATTGLPEHMCRSNVQKNCFVLRNMAEILDCLTRGLDLDILSRGYGVESRGVAVSFQAQASVLGAVLPSNSPGVHTLWLPVVPAADGPGAQARFPGTLDGLPGRGRIQRSRHSARSHQPVPGRP